MLRAHTDEVVDYYHGVAVADPFRWLEDANSPEVKAWTNYQRTLLRSYFESLPDWVSIRARIAQMLSGDSLESPWQVGSRLFYMKRLANQEQPCLMMEESGNEITLIDPNEDHTHSRTVQILQVSPDGKRIAVGEKIGGEDSCSVQFLDVTTRTMLPTRIARGFYRGVAFVPNRDYIYHAHERLDRDRPHYRAVYRHDLSTGEESEVFCAGEGFRLRIRVIPGSDEEWMLYLVREPGEPTGLYLHNPIDGTVPRQIYHSDLGEFSVLRIGTKCWALSRRPGNPRQIVAFNAKRPEPKDWEIVLPRVPEEVTDCTIWNNSICLTQSSSIKSQTLVYSLTGQKIDEFTYPEDGTVDVYARRGIGQKGIYYRYSSFACPPIVKQYDLNTQSHRTVFTKEVPLLPKHVETRREHYLSSDGVEIPITLAWDPENVLPAPGPLIFTAYGGFGGKLTAAYSPFVTFLLQQGFRFAFASVRGGSELGSQWYEAGRRRNKPKTIADFIAGAEWLITSGFTASKQLASFGGSASGLLVAAAMVQRPDLFRAVLCLVTLLDMLRYHNFDLTYRWIPEYGCADDPDDFSVLLSYSPYHKVRKNVAYPSVLFVTGEADNRTNPLHIRKMTGLLQRETCGRNPVLADISPVRGHSITMPLSARIDSLTDKLAFICNELGVRLRNLPVDHGRESEYRHAAEGGRNWR